MTINIAEVLKGKALSTRNLLAILGAELDIAAATALHRQSRHQGFGQCADNLWRPASESNELKYAYDNDNQSLSSEAFMALFLSNKKGWDIDTPLEAMREFEKIENECQKRQDENSAVSNALVDLLRSKDVPCEEINSVLSNALKKASR